MKVESKYIIRWGIPGWVYLAFYTIFHFIDTMPLVNVSSSKGITLLSTVILLAALGIPVGYLIHQVSMFFGFVIKNKWKDFFEEEIRLDEQIINTAEKGEKIRTRYRHLLARVHELRDLKYALILSGLTMFINININLYHCSYKQWIIFILVILVGIVTHINQRYFVDNLNFFKNRVIGKRSIEEVF